MGYMVETRGGKTSPINRVPPTPRVGDGDGEPGRKRTIYDHDGGTEARAVINTYKSLKVARAVKI